MAEFRVTSWRSIPSLVTARDDAGSAKVQLPRRFQEAIDEAAMRTGATDADLYLAGWRHGPWLARDGDPAAVAGAVAEELDASHGSERLTALLDDPDAG